MKTLLLVMSLLTCLFATGCQSLNQKLDAALPDGHAKKLTATITGKFSATTVDADNFQKSAEKVTADRMHFRHSNAWVPLIEVTVEDYARDRIAPAASSPSASTGSAK